MGLNQTDCSDYIVTTGHTNYDIAWIQKNILQDLDALINSNSAEDIASPLQGVYIMNHGVYIMKINLIFKLSRHFNSLC